MSLMKSVTKAENAVQERDVLGGYQLFDTDVYLADIKMVYIQESAGGALGATIVATIDGRDYRETIYFTNKKKETFFINGQNEQQNLPGYAMMNSLSMLITGVEFCDVDTEERTVKIYDYDAKADVNTVVDTVIDLCGVQIKLAIEKQLQDKTAKGDDNKYHPTGETIERNAIVKVFHAERDVTLTEAIAKIKSEFLAKWLEKNKGNVIDKTKKDGKTVKAGAPASGATTMPAAAKPKRALFDD